MRRRLAAAAALATAVVAALSPFARAREPGRQYAWPDPRPIADHQPARDERDPTRDVTFLVKPIRVDLDEAPPGRYGVRAVRLRVRGLQDREIEDTIAFEQALFRDEADMVAYRRYLESFIPAPILSLRVRVVHDPESPAWNRRWKAVALPYWIEIAPHSR
jgi:hypothetical protein